MNSFRYRNPDDIDHTGFSGWLNTETREVVLVGRLGHLDLISQSGKCYYDGTPMNNALEPINGDKIHHLESEGGPKGSGWVELRQWCAEQGWVHFVPSDKNDMLYFVCSSLEQEKVCKAFAKEACIASFFKYREYYGEDTHNQLGEKQDV